MAQVLVNEQSLMNIANAIRTKAESSSTYTPAQMAQAILDIPEVKIDSITTTPSSRELTITFSNLKGEPLAFVCTQEGQTTFSKSYRWIVSVTYDGTTVHNETHGVSGSSMIAYTFTNCTYTYNNGTLTITSPSSGANGYFKDSLLHRLIYIYKE